MKIFDTFMLLNEIDLLEIRLNILNDYVDYFVISEATHTFTYKYKGLNFEKYRGRFKKFENKIIYNIIEDTPENFDNWQPKHEYFTNRNKSYPHKHNGIPLRKLSLDFQREVYQRDSIINGLLDKASSEDIIICSDLDEIPNPDIIKIAIELLDDNNIVHCKQKWFMYYLNNLCDKPWFGTHFCKYKRLLKESMDLLQYHKEDIKKLSGGPIIENGGWHFSFLGGQERIKEKLRSYNYQGSKKALLLKFIDLIYKDRIQNMIKRNQDIFMSNRKFTKINIDEQFPKYIIENQHKYRDLII